MSAQIYGCGYVCDHIFADFAFRSRTFLSALLFLPCGMALEDEYTATAVAQVSCAGIIVLHRGYDLDPSYRRGCTLGPDLFLTGNSC